ncbi:histidinol-phosphate transaminase [Portibacter marinus]|uniref:histidinol-phosphate transaminase n=1 Tax=Portibacter marinus TaxID=2898660 RepID=UPI001F22C6D9|nr:histidinol-phosphate transaminase [Portibacter marinus]
MIQIPQNIQDLQPYKPGKSSDPSAYSRYKAILSSNENNYGPSPLAMNAIKDHLSSIHLYPDPQAFALTQKLSEIHQRPGDEIILSNGLDGLLYSMFKAFTNEGDHVITNDRSFVAFNKFAAMHNVNVTKVENIEYQFDLQSIKHRITSKTKMIYICNPNNPTGTMITQDEIKDLVSSIPSHILVVVDEAYFQYAKNLLPSFPDTSTMNISNILTLRTFSKLYGIAGVRIGYGMGSKPVIQALKKVKLVFNPNSLAQVAAFAALDDHNHRKITLDNNNKWMQKLEEQLNKKGIKYLKSYANFICSIYQDEQESQRFVNYMDGKGVLLRKLDSFGMPEGVRISIGTDQEMRYFSQILERFE